MNEHPLFRDPAEETWRLFRIMAEFVDGFEAMSQVGKAISIFGSARTRPSAPHYKAAREVGARLAREGFAVITGGGPGIMEAANRGAHEAGGHSIGLNIALPHEQKPNRFQSIGVEFHYFFVRKVMFVKYSLGLICFPGGFGTLDEFFESMTLIQTEKSPRHPVVLFDTAYWRPMIKFMEKTLLNEYGAISRRDLDLFFLTDDIDEAVMHVCSCVDKSLHELRHPSRQEELRMPMERRISGEGLRLGRPSFTRSKAKTRRPLVGRRASGKRGKRV
ncbi:MAG: TIGR00730 family Rossman fold protein [Phycisphaerae bacterium]|nr:TIGR00730 family Rossman fold protein [Phycisphaerae bacterium]